MKLLTGRGILKRFFSASSTKADMMKEMKLLIVDDEERFLYAMEKLLIKMEYDVQTAVSGELCLDMLREKRIDVVILDVKMPGLDGLETLRRIKLYHPLTEVLLLTGHGTVESAVEGLKCGATDFLMKPISAADLLEKVKEAFSRRRLAEKKIRDAQSLRFMQQSPGDIIKDANREAGYISDNE